MLENYIKKRIEILNARHKKYTEELINVEDNSFKEGYHKGLRLEIELELEEMKEFLEMYLKLKNS